MIHRTDKIDKKSKFQKRLDAVAAAHKERELSSGDTDDDKVNSHKMGYVPLPTNRDWVHLEEELPPYYAPVDIWDGIQVHEGWNRVSNGEFDYFVNPDNTHIKRFVTHWAKRPGITYQPYDPMTEKSYILDELKKELIPSNEEVLDDDQIAFNMGIMRAMRIVTKGLT